MAADSYVIDYVRHNSRPFIFCASIPPSNAACALQALRILKREPERQERLIEISDYVRKGLKERGISIRESNYGITPIIPLYTYTPDATLVKAKLLFEAGVYVNPVLPPATPPNECLLRTSYMASHTEPLLDEAMDIIKETFEAYDLSTSDQGTSENSSDDGLQMEEGFSQ